MSRPVDLKDVVGKRRSKPRSVLEPNTTTKAWANEIRLSGLESDKERQIHATPTALLAQPTVMHFGGYEINKKQTQVLNVVNKSADSVRVTLLKPTTPFFQLRWKREKPGFLAPGMSLQVEVNFAPTEWRYYYDCIRLNCGEEKILVPIHAYPVMNKAVFPKRFDVGKGRLGSTKKRTIKLKCTAPIAFEYEITVTKEHYDFNITPRHGVVPANGEVPIVVEFTPTKLSTSECKVMLNIAQFNYQPFETTIIGSGCTDFVSDIGDDDDKPAAFGTSNKRPTAGSLLKTKKAVGAGAVMDAGAEFATKMNRKNAKRAAARRAAAEEKSEYFAETEGIRIPHKLEAGHHMINFVLTQKKGKLKPKDLKKAIAEQHKVREAQMAALRAASLASQPEASFNATPLPSAKTDKRSSRKPPPRDRGPDSAPSLPHSTIIAEASSRGRESQPPQIREATFVQEMNDIEAEEKQREFKSAVVVGEPLMTKSEIQDVEAARSQRQDEIDSEQRENERRRTETATLGPYQNPPTFCTVPLAEVPKVVQHPDFAPTFNHYANDTWNMRKRVVQKFVASVTKFIVRRRVHDRLAALKTRLGVGSGRITREAVAALVEQDQKEQNNRAESSAPVSDNSKLETGADKEGSLLGAEQILSAKVHEAPVELHFEPFYERFSQYDSAGVTTEPVAPAQLPTYNNLEYETLVVPNEYELAGYSEDPVPAFATYVPSEKGRELRVGAIEEESFRPHKTLEELDQSEQAQLARVQHERYVDAAEVEKARAAFAKYDSDGSGNIDAKEMSAVLADLGVVNLKTDDPVLKSIMDSADVDDDGEVSFDEFLVFFRTCLVARGEEAARAGDASKRLDLTYYHPDVKPTPLPIQLAARVRAKPVYLALPPNRSVEFRPEYDLRPRPIGASLSQRTTNEQASVLQDAASAILSTRYEAPRAHFQVLPVFFQSPLECIDSNEFSPNQDLIPWRAERAKWHLTTPGGQTVAVRGTASDPVPAAIIERPELGVARDKDLRDEFENGTSSQQWQGVAPSELLLTHPHSDDDLSDSDTDSEDEWGLPLREGKDFLLTPAIARHFCEGLSFDALLLRELEVTKSDFERKARAGGADGSSEPVSAAAQAISDAVSARVDQLNEEITTLSKEAEQASGKGSDTVQSSLANVESLLSRQPRSVGSVFGRELQTEADGAAPSLEAQFASPAPADGGQQDDTESEVARDNGVLETEEQLDERRARERRERSAALARDTRRDLRWTNRGNGPGRPTLGVFARDAALCSIADTLDAQSLPRFHTLPRAVADATSEAVDPRLRVEL